MYELKDDKPSVYWKDKTFILWALPIFGSVIAIFFDYGYLHYFDIPAMYAEINFYTAALICFYLILGFIGVIFVTLIADMLSKSRHIVFRALVQPVPLLFCLILYWGATISNQPTILIYVLYSIFVGRTILAAVFDKSKDKSFNDKLDFAMKNMFSETEVKQTPSEKLQRLGAKVLGLILLMTLILMTCEYITKHQNIWVLSTNKSVIAIKRNNDVYILKTFNKNTMTLEQGFKILKIGEKPLELELMKPLSGLKTLTHVEYEKLNKEQQLQQQKDIEQSINSIQGYIENIKIWISRKL